MALALKGGLAGLLLVLVVFAPFPGVTRLLRALHNSAHAPVFGCIAVLLLAGIRSHHRTQAWSLRRQYAAALIVAAALGVGTELLQIVAARDASLLDVRNDVLGAIAFLAVYAAFDSRLAARGGTKLALIVIAVAAVLPAAYPVLRTAVEQLRREAQFPVLLDFDRRFDRHFVGEKWSVIRREQLPAPWSARSGEQSLRIVFQPGPWPGVDLYEPTADWSGYSALRLDLTNPTDSSLELVVRVHDRSHDQRLEDRFNARYVIEPRARKVLRIALADIEAAPEGRSMDMAAIAGVILFRTQQSSAGEMYLSRLWLE